MRYVITGSLIWFFTLSSVTFRTGPSEQIPTPAPANAEQKKPTSPANDESPYPVADTGANVELPLDCAASEACPAELAAPVVTLEPKCGQVGQPLLSTDAEKTWNSIAHQSLSVSVAPPNNIICESTELWMNGEHVTQATKINGESTRVFSCPPLGKHEFSGRYQVGGEWSPFSPAIRVNIVPPPAPEIVGVAASYAGEFLPVIGQEVTKVETDGHLRLQIGHTETLANITVYLDGKRLNSVQQESNCRYRISLEQDATAGLHRLTVRAGSACDCGVASEESRPLFVRYVPNGGDAVLMAGSKPCVKMKMAEPLTQTTPINNNAELDKTPPTAEKSSKCESDVRISHDAFSHLPCVERISECDHRRLNCSADTKSGCEKTANQNDCCCEYRFVAPAHFPLREFGPQGETVDQDGAIIYEGMRFSAKNTGQYEVSFVVGTPALPTTLRLQLLVQVKDTPPKLNKQWLTITLPPIEIKPETDSQGRSRPGSKKVTLGGYSAGLQATLKNGGEDKCIVVRREGTARFGFGYALAE